GGMPAEELKRRFSVRLAKEDGHYAYLELTPQTPERRFTYDRLEVALQRKRLSVRHITLTQPNGNTCTWTFKDVKVNAEPPVTEEMLAAGLPQGLRKVDLRGP